MNKELQKQIHRYAYDREIDYTSARMLGEQNGIRFKDSDQLLEFKNIVDNYLKTFNEKDFEIIESYLSE